MREYLKLLRVKHYIKNLLIFIPLFFSGGSDCGLLGRANDEIGCWWGGGVFRGAWGFVCFSLLASAIYIFNDIKDVEKDRNHPKKKTRPIASGRITKSKAIRLMIVCLVSVLVISIWLRNYEALMFLILYFGLNIAYSIKLKNKPIIDVVILASGFVIRIIYGGLITNIAVSGWLYLVTVSGSLYMGLGKRRNELEKQNNTREVLKYYNVPFLDKNMYVCVALTNVFYALWAMELSDIRMIWTVPIFFIILMMYSLDIERNSDGDPIEVILHNKTLIVLVVVYAVCIFVIRYIL